MKRTALLVLCAAAAVTAAIGTPAGAVPNPAPQAVAAHSAKVTVIATHLRAPRGVMLVPGGVALVSESGNGGTGPCIPGPEDPNSQVCVGLTSAVTAVGFGTQKRIITGLPSVADQQTRDNGLGLANTAFGSSGLVGVIGLGANPNVRPTLGAKGKLLGWLVGLSVKHKPVPLADIAGFEATHNPDSYDPGSSVDSDPFDVINTGHGYVVADAGGNDILSVSPTGKISVIAVLHARMVTAPPEAGLPPGTKIPMQAVPTSVVCGPDGALYVGQLTGFPFPVGGANVYRIGPDGKVTVFRSGFTNIIDITFDRWGNLYVLEIAKNGLLSGDPTGALIKVDPKGHRTEIAEGQLIAPGGMALGKDGSFYVTTHTDSGSDGQLVRVTP